MDAAPCVGNAVDNMLISWWKKRRRRRLLSKPFPKEWVEILHSNLGHYPLLKPNQRTKLHDDMRILIAETSWEGCRGLELTDEMIVTISAAACLLILGLDMNLYRRVQTILVYPEGYLGEHVGGIFEGRTPTLGEAHYRGPVILSWSQLLYDNRNLGSGDNLVFHEFAHQLDMLTGGIDGTPPLQTRELAARWSMIMNQNFRQLQRAAKMGIPTLLDQYGIENEGEFFSVTTECFFDRPMDMHVQHPELYELMADFFNVNPVEWFV